MESKKQTEDTVVKKETGKAAAVKKAPAKKAISPEVSVQSLLGGEISIGEIIRRVNEKVGGAAHDTFKIYIKSEENRAYYVADDKTGYVELW